MAEIIKTRVSPASVTVLTSTPYSEPAGAERNPGINKNGGHGVDAPAPSRTPATGTRPSMVDIGHNPSAIKSRRTKTVTASLTPAVHCRLDAFLRQQTELWNAALEERIDCYRKTGKAISTYNQCVSLTIIRSEDPSYSRFNVNIQRSALSRLDKAFTSFFQRKTRYPRFKSLKRGIRSFDIPKPFIRDGALKVKGIGKLRLKTVPTERIIMARVVKTASRVVVHFIVEVETETKPLIDPIGIDVGIKRRATLSTGEMIPPVSLERKSLKRKQRRLQRAKRNSNTRRKVLRSFQKEWQRIKICERNALHRLTTDIVKRHNLIAVEDMNINEIAKNKRLALSVYEQQWGQFLQQLSYKAESAGGTVIRVDPEYTSQDCSGCGNRKPKPPRIRKYLNGQKPLEVREYRCESCGLILDRDVNAARNILQRGISLAGWDMESSTLPGASKDVSVSQPFGVDAERYAVKPPIMHINPRRALSSHPVAVSIAPIARGAG